MSRKLEIELTNMCLVYDEDRILVQEKKGTRHESGLVFPGGHRLYINIAGNTSKEFKSNIYEFIDNVRALL